MAGTPAQVCDSSTAEFAFRVEPDLRALEDVLIAWSQSPNQAELAAEADYRVQAIARAASRHAEFADLTSNLANLIGIVRGSDGAHVFDRFWLMCATVDVLVAKLPGAFEPVSLLEEEVWQRYQELAPTRVDVPADSFDQEDLAKPEESPIEVIEQSVEEVVDESQAFAEAPVEVAELIVPDLVEPESALSKALHVEEPVVEEPEEQVAELAIEESPKVDDIFVPTEQATVEVADEVIETQEQETSEPPAIDVSDFVSESVFAPIDEPPTTLESLTVHDQVVEAPREAEPESEPQVAEVIQIDELIIESTPRPPESESQAPSLLDSIMDRDPTESRLELWDVATADRDIWLEENGRLLLELRDAVLRVRSDAADANALLDAAAGFDAYRSAADKVERRYASQLANRLAEIPWRVAEKHRTATEEEISLMRKGVRALLDLATGCYHPDDFQSLSDDIEVCLSTSLPELNLEESTEPAPVAAPVVAEEHPVEETVPEVAEASEEQEPVVDSVHSESTPVETAESRETTEEVETIRPPSNLLELYAEESAQLIDSLKEQIARLQANHNDIESVDSIYVASHTMVGASSAVGFIESSRIAGLLEGLSERVTTFERMIDDDAVRLLSRGVELLERMSEGGVPVGSIEELQDGIVAWTNAVPMGATLIDGPRPIAIESSTSMQPEEEQQAHPPAAEHHEESIPAELLEVFVEEAEDHLRNINSGLGQLRENFSNKEAIQEVRRSAHTLKGAAGAVGLRIATRLSHRMEDLLDELFDDERELDQRGFELLQRTADALAEFAAGGAATSQTKSDIDSIFADYDKLLADEHSRQAENQAEAISEQLPVSEQEVSPAIEQPTKSLSRPVGRQPGEMTRRLGNVLRVPIARMDELVRLVSELVINRTAFEQRMKSFERLVQELRTSSSRLKTTTSALQSDFEARALRRSSSNRISHSVGRPPSHIDRPFAAEFDELEFDRYTEFHELTRSLAESVSDVNALASEFVNVVSDFDGLLTRQSRLSRDLQDRLMRTRMVPLASLSQRLERTVRSTAQTLKKKVELELRGETTELDKTVLEELVEPLLHLMRNCVDHGVESPSVRRSINKSEVGKVFVHSYYKGTQVVVQVGDDGGGINVERLRQTAAHNGFMSLQEAASAAPQQLLDLLFRPGFSTAGSVSEISGRGVGLDVVRTRIEKLNGTIDIDSTPGRGTVFSIRLPMTLAIVRALLVSARGRLFAVPIQAVGRIVRMERSAVAKVADGKVMFHGGRAYSLYHLGDALNVSAVTEEEPSVAPVLVAYTGSRDVAVEVDRIISGREIVVKSLGSHLKRVHGLVGATLLGDGTIVPILNMAELFGSGSQTRIEPGETHVPSAPVPSERAVRIMVVDDSVSVRRVVSNLVKSQDWESVQARDGLDALEQIQSSPHLPDLVLLDVEMPRMNGFELLSALRSQEPYRQLPVVMVTSRAGDKHRRKAMDLGATDYVVKPYQDEFLLAVIRRLIAPRRN